MAEKPQSDGELLAQERRIYRTNMTVAICGGMALGIALIGGITLCNSGWLPWTTFNALVLPGIPIFVLIVAVFILLNRAPREARTEKFYKRHSDELLRRWRFVYPLLWFNFGWIAWDLSRGPASLDGLSVFALMALVLTSLTCFGPGWIRGKLRRALGDELVTALRKRAGFAGYIGLMTVLCLSYIAQSFHPEWTPRFMLWTLFVGAIAPQFYYLLLEIQAERGG